MLSVSTIAETKGDARARNSNEMLRSIANVIPSSLRRKLPASLRGDARKQVTIPFIVMQGVIQAGGNSGGPFQPQSNRINLQRFNGIFDKAFKTKNAPAVALVINSPGGSPVQSSLIYKRLLHLKRNTKNRSTCLLKMSVRQGVLHCCAADDIVVDESSIVGSIGVLSQSFGVKSAADKLGLEPRLLTAGRVKSQNNAFEVSSKQLANLTP